MVTLRDTPDNRNFLKEICHNIARQQPIKGVIYLFEYYALTREPGDYEAAMLLLRNLLYGGDYQQLWSYKAFFAVARPEDAIWVMNKVDPMAELSILKIAYENDNYELVDYMQKRIIPSEHPRAVPLIEAGMNYAVRLRNILNSQ